MKTIIKNSEHARSAIATESSLFDFFIYQLQDIYWAEKRLVKTLSKVQKIVNTEDLQQIFRDHLEETGNHVLRIEEIFNLLNIKAETKKSAAMGGLIREYETIIEQTEEGTTTRDAALIIAIQKIEHYEIATYGSLAQLATSLGQERISDLLRQTLQEEKDADILLTDIAERKVNWLAETEEKV